VSLGASPYLQAASYGHVYLKVQVKFKKEAGGTRVKQVGQVPPHKKVVQFKVH
jgi:hypothetical protein